MAGRWLTYPETRTEQPRDGADLRFSRALPRPAFVHIGAVPRRDLVSGRYGTHPTGDTFGSSQHGPALRTTRSAVGGLSWGLWQPLRGDRWTILVLANPAADGAIHSLYCQRRADGGNVSNPGMLLGANVSNAFAGRNGGIGLACQTHSIYPNIVGSHSNSTALVDGKWHVYAARRASASVYPELLFDGAPVPVSNFANGALITTYHAEQETKVGGIGGYTADATYSSAAHIALAFAWPDYLTDRQLAQIGGPSTVWGGLFAPVERRIWVPVSAPGGTPLVVDAGIGVAAATGRAAGISAQTIVAAALGSATAQGAPAGVILPTVVAAGVGAAAAQGAAAAVALQTVVGAQVGAAAAAGLPAVVLLPVHVAAAAGTAAASGLPAAIVEAVQIQAATGAASAQGLAASVSVGGRVDAAAGAAVATGLRATISATETIEAGVGAAAAAGRPAAVAVATAIQASAGAASAAGAAATVTAAVRVGAQTGAAAATGAPAAIVQGTTVRASSGAAAAAGHAATVEVLLPGSGTGATAAQIWAHVLPNGLTARQTLVDTHAMLLDLYLVHGLRPGVPLVVGPDSRAAGALVQSITEAGGVVTMERAP